jgi:dienelactone hydrolase
MVAYRAMPAGKTGLPVVLVVSEIFGVHEYIADVCRRLAKEGYLAIAPELFARYGDPRKYASVADLYAAVVSKVPGCRRGGRPRRLRGLGRQERRRCGRLAITGFCWGGRQTWLYAAHNPALKAGVAWYGRIDGEVNDRTPKYPLDIAAQLKAPVLGLYGSADQGIPMDDVAVHEGRVGQGRRQVADPRIRRRAACLPCRLPADLPQGSRGRRLEADAGVVAQERCVILLCGTGDVPGNPGRSVAGRLVGRSFRSADASD